MLTRQIYLANINNDDRKHNKHDKELLINSCTNFGQTNFERAVSQTHNKKIK